MLFLLFSLKNSAPAVALLAATVAVTRPSIATAQLNPPLGAQAVKIGAGGLVCGLQVAPDGTRAYRVDIYGAYIRKPGDTVATSVITTGAMPAGSWNVDICTGFGPYEVAIAPSLSSTLYMVYDGRVFKSVDYGAHWTLTNFVQIASMAGNQTTNGNERTFGRSIAVDPINPNVCLVGTHVNGLWRTTDGGTTWAQMAVGVGSVSAPGLAYNLGSGGGHAIAFDPTSPQAGSPLKTQGVYVHTYGVGLYHSADGGANWTAIPGSPPSHVHMICDQFGIVWLVANDGGGQPGNSSFGSLFKYNGSAWTLVLYSGGPSFAYGIIGIAVDPASTAQATSRVVALSVFGGSLYVSNNGGTSFPTTLSSTFSSADIPWLASVQNVLPLSAVDLAFDPTTGKVVMVGGVGVWNATLPASGTITWASESAGDESLTSFGIVVPPGGQPVTFSYDVPIFYVVDPLTFPSAPSFYYHFGLVGGWDVDWASSSPGTVVALVNGEQAPSDMSAVSQTGGQTFTPFASVPVEVNANFKIAGNIAASSPTNFLWAPSNGAASLYYTLDGGGTWAAAAIKNTAGVVVPFAGAFAYYLHRRMIAADRVLPNTFYLYHSGGTPGVFKSTDGGINFNQVYIGSPTGSTGFTDQMHAVPGKPGELFMSSGGPQSGVTHPSSACPFVRSTTGGGSWTAVAGVFEVFAYGFGAIFPGQTYPSICLIGWYNGVFGTWQSVDNCQNWTQIGDGFPAGILTNIRWIDGDKSVAGRWYFCGGSGWFRFG